MRIGVSFPQSEIGADTGGIRAYAQAIEEMGYTHITCGEHIVGVDTKRPGFVPHQGMPKDLRDIAYPYQEPLTFFAFLAGITNRIEFLSSVLILPQRQTVVVAKQAAQVDNLSGGRLRIGIGSGWSEYEYESLGMDFHTRGRRMEEQITVLRALWTQKTVTFKTRWHSIEGIGINPLPTQRPIPIWFGVGANERPLRRAARLGDGIMLTPGNAAQGLENVRRYASEAGRDPASIHVSMNLNLNEHPLDKAASLARQYESEGYSHLIVYTTDLGFSDLDQHIQKLAQFKAAVEKLS